MTSFADLRTGAKNCLTDIAGVQVGHGDDPANRTGVTAILTPGRAVAGVDIRGGAPGTRETDLLRPDNTVERVDGIVLSGGSAFGLAAADGVAEVVHGRGGGFDTGEARIPILPAAILYDIPLRPNGAVEPRVDYRALGMAAAEAASETLSPLGNVGAGFGARAGFLKGGLGTASIVSDRDVAVAALAAVNAFGSPVMPGSDCFWAWPFEREGEFGGRIPDKGIAGHPLALHREADSGVNTTLAVVATNATLDKASAQRVAVMAHDGFARALRPVHTPFDGDAVFVLATGDGPVPGPETLALIGTMAADCVARSIARGVYHAETIDGFRSYRESFRV
ncbi:MAG: P1 family peptidase [Alphaproteobacteria bacterium]|nr:P1 family peptidase [Alphaproteobacteria bacterium]